MAEIVDIREYRQRIFEKKAFGSWQKRFDTDFTMQTRLYDLPDQVVYFLSLPGDENGGAYYELIMGILDLGKAGRFHYLDRNDQLMVVDIHLFIADLARFELMRRLKWLDNLPCRQTPIADLVRSFDTMKRHTRMYPPALAPNHPGYAGYEKLLPRDREVFIRRLLPEALEEFKNRLEPDDSLA